MLKPRLTLLVLAALVLFVSCGKPRTLGSTPALLVPLWYADESGTTPCANDQNNGTSATCGPQGSGIGPLVHFSEATRRMGSNGPALTQAVTVTLLSSGTNTDPVRFVPQLVGNPLGPSPANFTLQCVPTTVASVTIGTYTAPNYTTGHPATITANGQSGAFWTQYLGDSILDVTTNALFWIMADLGNATAAISTPNTPGATSLTSLYAAVASGDTLAIQTLPKVYINLVNHVGYGGNFYIRQCNITNDFLTEFGLVSVYDSLFSGSYAISTYIGSNINTTFQNCNFLNTSAINPGIGAWHGSAVFFGGIVNGAGALFDNGSNLDGDVLVPLRFHFGAGQLQLRRVYIGQTPDIDVGAGVIWRVISSNYAISPAGARIWGPGGFDVYGGSTMRIDNGLTATGTLLLTGTLFIDDLTSAWQYTSASPPVLQSVGAITPAAIDASPGRGLVGRSLYSGSSIYIGNP